MLVVSMRFFRNFKRFFTAPVMADEELHFAATLARARAAQEAGFDVGFSFLPRYPDAPKLYVCAGRAGRREGIGSGYDFTSPAAAFEKALGETVERSLWMDHAAFWTRESRVASRNKIEGDALDFTRLAGFSSGQRTSELNRQFDDSTEFLWTKAVRLSDGGSLFVPAQLVSGKGRPDAFADEPLLRIPTSNGIAAHASFEAAALHGLLELIERDAFMITFFNRISPPKIDLSTVTGKATHAALAQMGRYGLTVDCMSLPTDMPAVVVACVVRDTEGGPAFAIGACARSDAETAVYGALTEAFGSWYLIRLAGLYAKDIQAGPPDAHHRIAYWARKENAGMLSWLTSGSTTPLPQPYPETDVRTLAQAVEQLGCTVGAVEMSPPVLRNSGLHAACVVSDGLQPLSVGHEEYLGGWRLRDVPEKFGFTPASSPPPYPHPFP